MNKIVTICGSFKFKKEMLKKSVELETKYNYIVLQPVYGEEGATYTQEEMDIMGNLHFERIKMSDAIYVVNVNGYIGESTKKEILYAKSLDKEILSLEQLDNI